MKRALACLLLLGCAGGPPAPMPSAGLLAGVAVVDLTPSRAVPLGGYSGRAGRPMTGVHDPVFAKALWLETPEARVCLVTADLIGATIDIRNLIRPEGVALILAASHTHSGPGALSRLFHWQIALGRFDEDLYKEVASRLKRAVEEARAARRPARLAFARGTEPAFCRNRCAKDGPVDPELSLLRVTDELGRPIAVVTNYAAHATVLSEKNFLLSADWPGAFQRALGERVGAPARFTNGAGGNIAPRAPEGREEFERAAAMGEALARKAADLLKEVEKPAGRDRISYKERGVDLPNPTLPLVPRKSVIGILEINGVRMFCFPGEPGVELGLELKARFPGSWVLGLANDHLGYFVTEAEYGRKDCYERKVSFYGPRMGPWIVDQLIALETEERY